MYQLLQAEQEKGTLQTISPSAFIAQYPAQAKLEELWAGGWASPDYLSWIGEQEENRAWDYLGQVRDFVEREKATLDQETLAQVMDLIYTAEGSDWFWWYGADQNSGDDGSFDLQFRLTLQQVYKLIGEPAPAFLKAPVIPQTTRPPAAFASDLISPAMDGLAAEGEWEAAGYYLVEGDALVSQLWYGFDRENLYLRLDGRRPWADVGEETRLGFYLARPGSEGEQFFSRTSLLAGSAETLLGFGANTLVEVIVSGEGANASLYIVNEYGDYVSAVQGLPIGLAGSTMEVAVPYADFGQPDAGDSIKLRAVVSEGTLRDLQAVPSDGPGELVVPDLGLTSLILMVADPENDDHGPGGYQYPSDGVFGPRAYDLTEFVVGEDDRNLIFRFTFAGPLNNDWGAPNGMGIHTLDVYIDTGMGGERKLLPGRNASIEPGIGWDFAIWAEGWTPGLFGPPTAGSSEPVPIGDATTINIISDPDQNRISIRVAKVVLAYALGLSVEELNPGGWGYLGAVLGQDANPASGVWRVRDVETNAQQWRFGGAPADINHTRIIDLAWPGERRPTQEQILSNYPAAADGDLNQLGPDDFALIPMLRVD